jgi:hypothetical protein
LKKKAKFLWKRQRKTQNFFFQKGELQSQYLYKSLLSFISILINICRRFLDEEMELRDIIITNDYDDVFFIIIYWLNYEIKVNRSSQLEEIENFGFSCVFFFFLLLLLLLKVLISGLMMLWENQWWKIHLILKLKFLLFLQKCLKTS